ncbi:hypothetical protein EMCG_02297 [[Emmonsia] crescens]|uniref:CFEM domain-containing protein n=1 Tax=[Emmonsia] crescens TaxID=73230 RepID=A0A0G2HZZ6_9EURO|nr:hypothetical protein EMCG_02297 [Emmonsia crescens UAMH 3008]
MKPNPLLLALSTLLTLFTPAYSQTGDQIPKCAHPCQEAVERVTDCRRDDYKCICKPENFNKIAVESAPCVYEKCGMTVAFNEVMPAVDRMCEAQK